MSLITPSLHMDLKNPEITALVCKALSSEVRLKILDLLTDYPKNISDLADILDIPMSTMTTHIRKKWSGLKDTFKFNEEN